MLVYNIGPVGRFRARFQLLVIDRMGIRVGDKPGDTRLRWWGRRFRIHEERGWSEVYLPELPRLTYTGSMARGVLTPLSIIIANYLKNRTAYTDLGTFSKSVLLLK